MSRRVTLKKLLLLASLPAVVLPVLLLALLAPWYYHDQCTSLEARIEEDLLQGGAIRVRLIEAVLGNAEDTVQEMAVAWPALAASRPPDEALQELAYRSRAIRQLWVVGPDGRVLQASRPADRGKRLGETADWKHFRERRAATYSDVIFEPPGRWSVRLLVPLSGERALVAVYDVTQLQRAFYSTAAQASERASILVGEDGRVISHTDSRLIGTDLSDFPPAARALNGYAGAMVYRPAPGAPERTAAYMPITSQGWALVLEQPAASTMMVSARVLELWLMSLLVGGILLAWFFSAVLGRRVVAPIAQVSAYLQRLAGEPVAPERIGHFPPTGIEEPDQLVAAGDDLYRSLAETIAQLEVKSRELRLANAQLGATVEDLERLDRLRSEFLNVLSHDLRIPITVAIGYAELLQDSPHLAADERGHAEAIIETCHRMETMLNELLDYARLESGRMALDRRCVALGELAEEARAFFLPLAEQKGLRLDVAADGPAEASADPERLRQVLTNLVSNAIKYTPAGGRVTLRVGERAGHPAIEISDTGVGLSEEDRAHLFEKFYRSKRPEVQREKGTGLGLVIAQGIVEAHGGSLTVESAEGRGSTFRVTLPDGCGHGGTP